MTHNRKKITILTLAILIAVISFTSILADEGQLATGSNVEREEENNQDKNTSDTSNSPSAESVPESSKENQNEGIFESDNETQNDNIPETVSDVSKEETSESDYEQQTGAISGAATGTVSMITSLASASQLRGTMSMEDEAEGVFQVALPVVEDGIFDFIIDPQELIEKTDAAAYDGKTFEKGATVFFANSGEERENDYSSSSECITIVNQGAIPVEVILTAKVSPSSIDGVAMSEDIDFTDNTTPGIYLALTDGENTKPVDEVEGAEIQEVIPAARKGQENEYSFWLTGAANKNSDWSEVSDVSPEITVTWTVRPADLQDIDETKD